MTACSTWGPAPVAGVRVLVQYRGRVVLREGVGDGRQVWELLASPWLGGLG